MALEGTLNYLDIAHLLQVVGTSKKTGVLEISWQERQARLFFENGGLIRAEANRSHEGIGTLLVNAGLLSPEDLDAALDIQREDSDRRRLGAILCDELRVEPSSLQQMLRRQFQEIVFDVFSWPGGSFVFQFSSPEEIEERFTLDAVAFILDVGVQAGLLAEEGMDRQGADPERVPLALLTGDEQIAESATQLWRRKGHQILVCERVEELMGFLDQVTAEGDRSPVALVDLDHMPSADVGQIAGVEVLDGLHSLHPDVPVVALGGANELAVEAHRRGAGAFVRTPSGRDRSGTNKDTHLEVFALRLEKAVQKTTASGEKEMAG